MKNKVIVTEKLDRLRNNIKNINYLVNTGGTFEDFQESFAKTWETLEKIEELVSIENDPFKSNQII